MEFLNKHNDNAHSNRIESIVEKLIFVIPSDSKILDVGCGDGLLASRLKNELIGIDIQGVDTVEQKKKFIPVELFDGRTLPYPNKSFDVVLLMDVLHHAREPSMLLKECMRVSRKAVIIKDHTWWNPIGLGFLYLSDYISNKPKGVDLPMNFIHRSRWPELFKELEIYDYYANWNWKQKKGFDPVRHIFIHIEV